MVQKLTILAIDDDPSLLKSLGRILKLEPVRLLTSCNPQDALGLLNEQAVGLVLLDLRMPGQDGISVLKRIKKMHPQLPVLMLTGHGSIQDAVKAVKLGAYDFFEKPCPPTELISRIREFYPDGRPKSSSTAVGDTNSLQLIGESPPMQKLKKLIQRIAPSDTTVLIHGETGVGKELVARSIHARSRRSTKLFVPVDCATISEKIIESELFGHRRGSFTGAVADKKGLFLEADGGSLFLDEIGEFHLDLQSKLLRVLQERQVRPVGSNRVNAFDVRLIAATNRDLSRQVAQGLFREDLYYRLATIIITVPPLRERRDDLPLLVETFLSRHAPKRELLLSNSALDLLLAYNWPGNVRELENAVLYAITLCENKCITPEDLPPQILDTAERVYSTSLDNYEKTALRDALAQTGGNRRQTATLLGISEATLYRKLKRNKLVHSVKKAGG